MTGRISAEIFPPGEFIRDELEARGWTQTDLAEILGRPFRLVNEIISGKKSITPETAHGLGEAFGTDPLFWLNLESVYRLALARKASGLITRKARMYQIAPIKDMLKRQWIEATSSIGALEKQLEKFFELEDINQQPRFHAVARKKTDYSENTPSQIAWYYRARQLAATLKTDAYKSERLDDLFDALRSLTVHESECRKLSHLLSEFGIRLVIIEHLPKTRIDGAAFWLDSSSPVVCLSIRYDRIDGFWHTLAHELGHIRNGDGESLDDDLVHDGSALGGQGRPECEVLADEFACQFLIPQDELQSFIARVQPHYTQQHIIRFANRIKVHPGIILGQLQHRGEIPYSQWRTLLVKVRDQVIEGCLTDGWGRFPSLL